MQQEGKRRWLRAPSPAMIVALIALVFAMSGTAVAASKLISGDKIIKIGSLSGNRLRSQTVTGTQIKVSTLGKVPSAATADSATNATHAASADSATNANHATTADTATNATHATSADTATNANALGGIGPSVFGSHLRLVGTDFQSPDPSTVRTYGSSAQAVYRSAGIFFLDALVRLPQGAKITQIVFYFDNTGVTSAGWLRLWSFTLAASGTTDNLLATVTGDTVAGYGATTLTLSTPVVVDNQYNYQLIWQPNGTNQLRGADINYTLP